MVFLLEIRGLKNVSKKISHIKMSAKNSRGILNNCMRKIILFFVTGLLCFAVYAQKNPYNEVSIASPTAGSLGKYADIPVNKHTGIPGISIPLYTIKEGPLDLSIGLSYHAGGLKVMEPASWVGAGWSLNAGGVITRTVRGAPDEKGTSSVDNQVHGYFSDYGYSSYSYYQPGSNETDYFMLGKADGEPDLFSFNFGSYSGKFYFRDDRTPVLEPQQDIKVAYDYSGSGSINSFVLTTPDGTRYYFGTKNNPSDIFPVERTNPVTAQSGYVQGTVISSWYLSKIESEDGLSVIKLNYQPETYSYYTISMFPLESLDNTSYEYNIIKDVVNGVRLDSISFSNGKISFIAGAAREDLANGSTNISPEVQNNEAKGLGEIQITNRSNFCKKYTFSYQYFTDNTPLQGYFANYGIQSDAKRLKLTSVQEQSCDGSLNVQPYTFDYFTEQVPRRLSFGQDHWGFYNGVTTNTKLIASYTINNFIEYPGANRDASWPAMRGGALRRINYPTGGYSDFEFEPNNTWASSLAYNNTYRFNLYVGYGSSVNPIEQYQNFTANPYKITLSNSSAGGTATITVYNSSNNVIQTLSADQNETKNVTFQPGAGTYRIVLYKTSPSGSYGATADFYERIPYNYERNEIVGGLRIKTITHNDGNQNMVTSYAYTDANNHSTGILYNRPVYIQVIRNDEIKEAGMGGPNGQGPPVNTCNPNGCLSCDWGGSLIAYKSASGIRPLGNSQGNHIGYNEVTVSQTGNGYSKYVYYGSDRWDVQLSDVAIRNAVTTPPCNLSLPNYPDVPLPFEAKRGEPKFEWHYNEAGQLVKAVTYYHTFAEEAVGTPGRIVTEQLGGGWRFGSYYEIKAVKKIESSLVETLNAPSGSIITTSQIFFESQYHYQLTRKLSTNSIGENIESKFKYAADFRVGNCDAFASPCYQTYQNAVATHLMNYNIAKSSCATDGCIYNNYQTYRANLAQARRDYIACMRGNNPTYIDPKARFAACFGGAKSTADAELKPILELQEQNDFTPIETTEWVAGKLAKAAFNRFDYVTNPTGKVYLNKTQLINLAALSATFASAFVNGNTLAKDNRYDNEASLKFDGGNLVELTKKDGVVNTYIWGYKNNYPIAKIVNAPFTNVYPTLNQNILQNPTDDVSLRNELANLRTNFPSAHVTTYTYQPLIGITSETDASGRTIFYQYDLLGRLSLIRDKDNNILTKFCYNYKGQQENCSINTTPQWQTTGNYRCVLNGNGQNTGYQEREERDNNTYSTTYNQLRWVDNGYNASACPPPSNCNYSNCYWEGYKCVYGQCEQGYRVNTYSYYDYSMGQWVCVYHYEFSDGSWSNDYYEYSYQAGCYQQ
jgi:YD repeat-containing protein